MMIKKVRKIARIFLISCALFLPSFSFSSYAEDVNDELAYDGLQVRSYGNNNYLNPDAGLSNSIANSRDTTTYNFSGNGTFGGQNNQYNNLNVTADGGLTIESGATLSNVTLNQTIGNSTEMNVLIQYIMGIYYCITRSYTGNSNSSVIYSENGYSISIPLINYDSLYYTWDGTGLTPVSATYWGTFPAMLNRKLTDISWTIQGFCNNFNFSMNQLFDVMRDSNTYEYWTLSPSSESNGETFVKSVTSQSGTWHSVILNRLNYISSVIEFFFNRFFDWYYPLDIVDPTYWRYWNSDNQSEEHTNLAGVLYNITWYLGNLYILESASAALDNMEEAVENVTSTFESVEAQEQAVVDSISSHINSFNPNVSDFGIFKAIPWMSNYLQLIYISLGTYGTVITVGLFLGVCMQIIGFLRYK